MQRPLDIIGFRITVILLDVLALAAPVHVVYGQIRHRRDPACVATHRYDDRDYATLNFLFLFLFLRFTTSHVLLQRSRPYSTLVVVVVILIPEETKRRTYTSA